MVIGDIDGDLVATVAAEFGPRAVGLPLDVRDPDGFEAFLDDAERRIGPLDVLVNNAGIGPIGAFVDEDPRETQRTIDINLGGVLTGTRLALSRFHARGHGHIVNLASSAGQIAPASEATYAATKHAVVGFTRAIRAETRDRGPHHDRDARFDPHRHDQWLQKALDYQGCRSGGGRGRDRRRHAKRT